MLHACKASVGPYGLDASGAAFVPEQQYRTVPSTVWEPGHWPKCPPLRKCKTRSGIGGVGTYIVKIYSSAFRTFTTQLTEHKNTEAHSISSRDLIRAPCWLSTCPLGFSGKYSWLRSRAASHRTGYFVSVESWSLPSST